MRKFILYLFVCSLAAAGCVKENVSAGTQQDDIQFKALKGLPTKAESTVFPIDKTFGAYAWTAGTAGEYFMENEEVSHRSSDGAWVAGNTYLWPWKRTVDFFCYYPYGMSGLSVSKTSISYTDIDFSEVQEDIMYSDKAVGYWKNSSMMIDGVYPASAANGVPILFRHAASRLSVNVILGYEKKLSGLDTLRWEVSLKSASLSGLKTKGSVSLSLSDPEARGSVSWVKPSVDGYAVWTPKAGFVNDPSDALYSFDTASALSVDAPVTAFDGIYVLPQKLEVDMQKLHLTFEVKTYKKRPGESDWTLIEHIPSKESDIDLLVASGDPLKDIHALQMNKAVNYIITVGPSSSEIIFDPMVDAWETVNVTSTINLDI